MSLFRLDTYPGLDAIFANGEWRILASRPSAPEKRCFRSFSEAVNPVIPRSQWRAISRPRTNVPILDQDGRGACVGHGGATAQMLARDIAGQTFQLLSAPFLYAQINGGSDNGADPADAAARLQDVGICLMSEFPEPNYRKSDIPQSAYETAKRFIASEVYQCMSFDELATAFMLGYSCFDTIQVGNNFNNLDSDGVPPVSRGAGNHCVALGDALKQTKSGEWVLEHRNSWGTGWGLNGRYFQREAHGAAQGQYYEAYAIKSVIEDPLDPLKPPTR